MFSDPRNRTLAGDLLIAAVLVVSGVALSAVSLIRIANTDVHLAQATQPLQASPPASESDKPPAEAKPGGDRPTTPAPEPAQPDPQTKGQAVKPALPPAPAEKMAPPIQK